MSKKIPPEMQLLDEWIKRLGLDDWAIVLQTDCHPSDMSIPDAVGCTSWQESTKTAMIQIADPKKIDGLTRPFDFEEVLVHELWVTKSPPTRKYPLASVISMAAPV